MIKPMTSPPREKTMMIMPSMLENSALFTSTNLVVMAIEPIISKRMMINVSIISKIVAKITSFFEFTATYLRKLP